MQRVSKLQNITNRQIVWQWYRRAEPNQLINQLERVTAHRYYFAFVKFYQILPVSKL